MLLANVGSLVGAAQEPSLEALMRTDPDALVEPLAVSCGECHRSELAVWERTRHATGFDELHRRPRAIEIAEAMDVPLVKRNSLCLGCHYTPVAVDAGAVRGLHAGSGVGCQSCHGEARDWIDVHNDYGVAERDFQRARTMETPEHRRERIARSAANGMRRGSDVYAVASSCYECHIVAVEELVNRSDHRTGTADFELTNWSQGRIRHNFLDSYLAGDGTENAETPPERRRLMYAVGRFLELEFSLRAFAVATAEDGRYFRSLKSRIESTVGHVERIGASAPLREVDEILAAVRGLRLELGNTGPLLRAADRIAAAAERFAATHEGDSLTALDPMIAESHEFLPLFSR